MLDSAMLTDSPYRRAVWPEWYGTGDDGSSSRVGVILSTAAELSWQAGRDGMGIEHTRAEPGWEKTGAGSNGQGSKGYPEL